MRYTALVLLMVFAGTTVDAQQCNCVGQGIDNIGIQPHVELDLSNNSWLDIARRQMAGTGQ